MAEDHAFQNWSGGNRGGNRRQQRREPGFGSSVLLRLASVDEESNTLSGTVVGGLRHGEEVEGVSFVGRTKPKHLLKQNTQSYIDPDRIASGEVHMIVDGLQKDGDKVTARWMRQAGEHVVYSTPDDQKWMAVVQMTKPWPADDDEPSVPRYGVMTADVGAGVAAQSLEDLRTAFLAAASLRNGFGSVHLVLHAEEKGRRTNIDYPPAGGEAGAPPAKTPEQRFDDFIERVGEESIVESFGNGYTATVTPLSMRTLSKYETTRLIESESRMAAFQLPSHGRRLAAEMRRAKQEDRDKVDENFQAWAKEKGVQAENLQSADNRVVERFVASHGVRLPNIGNLGYLPAGYSLRAPDEDGRQLSLVTKLVPTARPVPANFMPIAGDEKAPSKYYEAYRNVAKVLLAAPGVAAAVDKAAAEQVAQAEAEEGEGVDATLAAEFDDMLHAADFALEGQDDPGEPDPSDPSDEERPEM